MIISGINELSFEPKMPVVMDAIGTTQTPENMRPIQGPLVNQRYKPTTWRYNVRLSAAPTQGSAQIQLLAQGEVIKTVALSLNGVTQFSGKTSVSLASVAGESELSVAVVVDSALDAGITAEVDSVLSIEIPLAASGSC